MALDRPRPTVLQHCTRRPFVWERDCCVQRGEAFADTWPCFRQCERFSDPDDHPPDGLWA